MHQRPARSLVSAVLIALTSILLQASPAAAGDPPLVTCFGEEIATYQPGLTIWQERDVAYTADIDYGLCLADHDVTAAFYREAGFLEDATCLAIPSTATATITWVTSHGEETSTVKVLGAEVDVVGAEQLYTSVGKVTSGRYAGHKINIVVNLVVDPHDPAPCLSLEGLTELRGPSTLTVVG